MAMKNASILTVLTLVLGCPGPKGGDDTTGTGTTLATTSGATLATTDEVTTGTDTTTATTTDTTTDTTGTSVCADHPVTDACCCFELAGQGEGYTANRCPAEPMCPTIMGVCAQDFMIPDCPADMLTTSSDAAIQCALEALRDGKVGRIDWQLGGAEIPGQSGELVSFALPGDGTMFRWGYDYFDLLAEVLPAVHATLQPAQYFDDCLALPTAPERFVCLRGAPMGEIEVCVAGYDADYF